MNSTEKVYSSIRASVGASILAFGLVAGFGLSALADVQVPPEVEAQAQTLEERFTAVLGEECPSKVCVPVGCEILGFKTLDQKQNASLPGLDNGDDVADDLHFRLSSARCDFAYESTLTSDAVTALKQRLNAKLQKGKLSLSINGRKLNVLSQTLPAATGPGGSNAPAPVAVNAAEHPVWSAFAPAVPNAVVIMLGTMALVALIWAFRRVGKAPVTETATSIADTVNLTGTMSAEKVATETALSSKAPEPSALMVISKRDQLAERLQANPEVTEQALLPLLARQEVADLCRVLQHFGPAPLAGLAEKPEYRDVFTEIRKRYQDEPVVEANGAVWSFLERLERLVALAQLGRAEKSVEEELAFLNDLAPDEFVQLARDLSDDELMAVLSFVPASLRARYFKANPDASVEAYVGHILRHPRLPDQLVRQTAARLRANFVLRHAEIKSVSRDQLPILQQLLNTLPSVRRDRLVRQLKAEQPAVFEQLLSEVLLDGALVHAPESVINEIFLNLSPEEGAAYLRMHPQRAQILAKLKGPLAKSLGQGQVKEGVRVVPRLGLEAHDFAESEDPATAKARERIVEILKATSRSGALDLKKINEAAVGVS